LVAIAFVGVGSGIFHGVRTTRDLEMRQLLKVRSQTYLNRVMSLNYGKAGDPQPTSAELDELFDDDSDLGSVTLMSLTQTPVGHDGWRFRLADFPVEGQWLVSVNHDLDGDGNVAGGFETSGELVRITVFFEGEALLWTIRGKETQS
jgi:hypothetical protein